MSDAVSLPFPTALLPVLLLAGWNILVFGLFAFDKMAAIRGRWRVPERKLIACMLLFGSAGALLGQRLLRHKTRKPPFTWLIPTALVLQALVLAARAALFVFAQNS